LTRAFLIFIKAPVDMKIELDNLHEGQHKITTYSNSSITVANASYRSNIILTTDKVLENCLPKRVQDMDESHLNTIIALNPEIVLFGTGGTIAFPADDVCQLLYMRQIGFEVMNTGAACRSFNFLLGEGRKIVSALFMID